MIKIILLILGGTVSLLLYYVLGLLFGKLVDFVSDYTPLEYGTTIWEMYYDHKCLTATFWILLFPFWLAGLIIVTICGTAYLIANKIVYYEP